ncbi:MAG: MerR family transcriptional regulator [Bacteroidota bacterium]
MATYSIKDLETLSGIKAHTIRIWEQRYGIIKPGRTDTNIRYYDGEELRKLLKVSLLNKNGFRISKIAEMSDAEIRQRIIEIERDEDNEEVYISGLIDAMVNTDEEHFDKILSSTNTKYGFEKTMINIIYPFLKKIGVLWMTGSINPAQEHFITNLIRQKTISAIDAVFVPMKEYGNKYVLFLPEGELHELSLLFAYYLLKVRKQQVIYLGQNLPLADLNTVCEFHKPDYILSIFTSAPDVPDMQDYVNAMCQANSESKIVLTGGLLQREDISLPGNALHLESVTNLMHHLEETHLV